MAHLALVALVVREYAPAIDFFVNVLQFELVEDVPSVTTTAGPSGGWSSDRSAGRPGSCSRGLTATGRPRSSAASSPAESVFFLRVDDFAATYARMLAAGVRFVTSPRREPYGEVAVFLDLEGNRWDLLGPLSAGEEA